MKTTKSLKTVAFALGLAAMGLTAGNLNAQTGGGLFGKGAETEAGASNEIFMRATGGTGNGFKISVEQFGGEAPEMSGAAEVLNKVRARGLKRVLVTGSAQQSLLTRLEKHYPGHFTPEFMVTGDDVRYGKPNPEPYLMALKKAGVVADEALVVENAPLGVRAAVAAGIRTIAVNTGPLDPQLLLNEGASWLFPSMQALADHFDELPL